MEKINKFIRLAGAVCCALMAVPAFSATVEPIGLLVNGEDICATNGPGWALTEAASTSEAYGTRVLTLNGLSRYVLTGSATDIRILSPNADVTVVASNLTLKVDATNRKTVFDGMLAFRCTGEATLELAGTNYMSWTGSYFGAGVFVNRNTHLTIRKQAGSSGSLQAKGGVYGAGIGGYCSSSGPITIESGTIAAYGGQQGAGIGAGDGWNRTTAYGDIVITGGYVIAAAGTYSSAIGSGNSCEGGAIHIRGGTVIAYRNKGYASIGNRYGGTAFTTEVTGGNVYCDGLILPQMTKSGAPLYCVTAPCAGTGLITVTGVGDYGVNDIYPVLKQLYLRLPNGTYHFTAGNIAYSATVNGSDVTATPDVKTVTFTIPSPLPEHVASVSVRTNGVDVTSLGSDGVYTLLAGSALAVSYTTQAGWIFTGIGTTTGVGTVNSFSFNPLIENTTMTADDIGTPVVDTRTVNLTVRQAVLSKSAWLDTVTEDGVAKSPTSTIAKSGMTTYIYTLRYGTKVDVTFSTGSTGWIFSENKTNSLTRTYASYTADTTISTSALALEHLPVTLTLPYPTPAHIGTVTVFADGEEVTGVNGVYTVPYQSTVTAVFETEEGYEYGGGGTTYAQAYISFAWSREITESEIPARHKTATDPDVAAVISAGGATNYYHSVTTACARLVTGDTLCLLTNCTERLNLDTGFAVTLDGRGWTVSPTNVFALSEAGTALTVRNVTFDGANASNGFFQVDAGASLVLTNVTARNYRLAEAPLVWSEGAFTLTDCALSNNTATALFRLANGTNDVRRIQLVSTVLANNVCTDLVDVMDGGIALGPEFWTQPVRLRDGTPRAFVAPRNGVPAGDVYLAFDAPQEHVGATVVSNVFDCALAAANVRICAAGFAAFGENGNITLNAAWSRPFVTVVNRGVTGLYETAADAIGSLWGDVDLRLLVYRNDVLQFQTNVVTGDVSVPAERKVTLDSILRHSSDGTNTTWTVTTNKYVTLDGDLDVYGTAEVNRVKLGGSITIHPGGVLRLGPDFLDADNLYITMSDPEAMGTTPFIVSATGTASQALKSFCRVTNVGWTFEPVEGGLRVKRVEDIAARIGTTEYTTFVGALTNAANGATVNCITLTNADTAVHVDTVMAAAQTLTLAEGRCVRIGSERRTTSGADVTWDDQACTTLDLDQSTLALDNGAELDLQNVSVTGVVRVTGGGLLVVTNYAGNRISVAFEVPSTPHALSERLARGNVETFTLVGEGELVQDGEYVYWCHATFSWSYRQNENGIAYIDINDAGVEVNDIKVKSETGTFSYTYTSDRTGEHTLTGYILFIDYDHKDSAGDPKPIVRLPNGEDVACSYQKENGDWASIRDGDEAPIDWYVNGDGSVNFAFTPVATGVREERSIYGYATPKNLTEEEHQSYVQKACEPKDGDDGYGAALGTLFAGAGIAGIGAGIFAGLQAVGPGGALAGGVGGLNGLLNVIRQGMRLENLIEKFKKFHDAVEGVIDIYTFIQMAKDLFQMAACPLEYKGVPYTPGSFESVHKKAAEDNDPSIGIHWFFSTEISQAVTGNDSQRQTVDISAAYSVGDFFKNEAAVGSIKSGSPLERFMDAANWFMRADAILTTIITKKPQYLAIISEAIGFIRQILNASRARGYFDPPADKSVTIPASSGYAIDSMNFGIMERVPTANRTAPVLEVQGRLKLKDCKIGRYSYNCKKGIIHVPSGGVLTLEDVTVEDTCTSADGTPVIVADAGGVVWVTGNTTIPAIAQGTDIRIGKGIYRDQDATSAGFSGRVNITGETKLDSAIGNFAFMDSTTNDYSRIHSASYDGILRPVVTSSGAKWKIREGAEGKVVPGFEPPFTIELITVDEQKYARLSGCITNVLNICTYEISATESLTNGFKVISSGTLEIKEDGSFTKDVPIETASGFFKVGVKFD